MYDPRKITTIILNGKRYSVHLHRYLSRVKPITMVSIKIATRLLVQGVSQLVFHVSGGDKEVISKKNLRTILSCSEQLRSYGDIKEHWGESNEIMRRLHCYSLRDTCSNCSTCLPWFSMCSIDRSKQEFTACLMFSYVSSRIHSPRHESLSRAYFGPESHILH